jgi:hypothetical protein
MYQEIFLKAAGPNLRCWRLAPQHSFMKLGNLGCREKADSKFQKDAGFLCDRTPTTIVALMDMTKWIFCPLS